MGDGAAPFDGWREVAAERDALRSVVRRDAAGWYWVDTPDGIAWLRSDGPAREPATDAEQAAIRAALAATDG